MIVNEPAQGRLEFGQRGPAGLAQCGHAAVAECRLQADERAAGKTRIARARRRDAGVGKQCVALAGLHGPLRLRDDGQGGQQAALAQQN